jgi:dienelactone hydrolase
MAVRRPGLALKRGLCAALVFLTPLPAAPVCAETAIGGTTTIAAEALAETVRFPGPAGQQLTGYLFRPAKLTGRAPAIVLLHGRAGPYSTLANGVYDASTLSKRHKFWGAFWAARGYSALLVDSFGPRGYPQGFPIHSYGDRPDTVNEVTVRPLDAYAALAWLKTQSFVDPRHVALQGWSNGGSTTLATMADVTLAAAGFARADGFVGGLAFYPACGLHHAFDERYKPYAPVRVLSGDADEEVSAAHCQRFVDMSAAQGGDIAINVYPGATHDFDDPGAKRQGVEANARAFADAAPRAEVFMRQLFGQ